MLIGRGRQRDRSASSKSAIRPGSFVTRKTMFSHCAQKFIDMINTAGSRLRAGLVRTRAE